MIRVRIHRESACGHCNARGMCNLGESRKELLKFRIQLPDLQIGDDVEVTISRSMGNKAVLLGYLIPFLLLVSVLILLMPSGFQEWIAGILSLASLAPIICSYICSVKD